MSDHPVTQQPVLTNSGFELIPNEYIRFEYSYKPGCCCFSSKTTAVTNMRLVTHVTKIPTICSGNTSTGKVKSRAIFLTDINDKKQLQSFIPSSQNKWWMKCIDILTCRCSNQQINWLESCRGMENLAMDANSSMVNVPETSLVEKF